MTHAQHPDHSPPMVKKHGIHEQESNDRHIEDFHRIGFTVFKNLISKGDVEKIKKAMFACYDRQVFEVGGLDNLTKMKDVGTIRSLFAYDEIFLKLVLMEPTILKYLDIFLDGAFTLFSQVGILSKPRTELYATTWHREIQYQHFTSSRPIAAQSLFILDPFNEMTGGTFFLPYSHLFDKFPSDEFVTQNEIQPVLSPGDVVLMNSMLYHRAGLNTSPDYRLLITNTFTRPILAPQFNYSKMIDPKGLTPKEKELLGFRWNYSKTMLEWRMDRINSD